MLAVNRRCEWRGRTSHKGPNRPLSLSTVRRDQTSTQPATRRDQGGTQPAIAPRMFPGPHSPRWPNDDESSQGRRTSLRVLLRVYALLFLAMRRWRLDVECGLSGRARRRRGRTLSAGQAVHDGDPRLLRRGACRHQGHCRNTGRRAPNDRRGGGALPGKAGVRHADRARARDQGPECMVCHSLAWPENSETSDYS